MKYIIGIIKPHRLDPVPTPTAENGIEGITVSEVKGHGRQKGHSEIYRGAEYQVSFLPKVKIEMAIDETREDEVVSAITGSAGTGKIGDGKVFVLPLESAVRIRTCETGKQAI